MFKKLGLKLGWIGLAALVLLLSQANAYAAAPDWMVSKEPISDRQAIQLFEQYQPISDEAIDHWKTAIDSTACSYYKHKIRVGKLLALAQSIQEDSFLVPGEDTNHRMARLLVENWAVKVGQFGDLEIMHQILTGKGPMTLKEAYLILTDPEAPLEKLMLFDRKDVRSFDIEDSSSLN